MASLQYRHERTLQGYAYDEVKSALQKSIRMGDEPGAVYWALEAFSFKRLQVAEPAASGPRIQRLLTNTVNRLRIIVVEDVGLASLWCVGMFRKMEKGGWCEASVAQMAAFLARTPKSRLLSWLRAAYNWPCGVIPSSQSSKSSACAQPTPLVTSVRQLAQRISLPPLERLKHACALLGPAFEQWPAKKVQSGVWYPDFAQLTSVVVSWASGPQAPAVRSSVAILLDWYSSSKITHREKHMYGMHAFCLAFLAVAGFVWDPRPEAPGAAPAGQQEWELSIATLAPPRPIPEAALDKHTATGRRAGKGTLDFRLHGSEVANECEALRAPDLKALYQSMTSAASPEASSGPVSGPSLISEARILSPAVLSLLCELSGFPILPLESDLADQVGPQGILAQNLCGRGKHPVFLGRRIVLKAASAKSMIRTLILSRMLRLLGDETILDVAVYSGQGGGRLFLGWPSVGDFEKLELQELSTPRPLNPVPRVAKRATFVQRLSDYSSPETLSAQQLTAIIRHLILRAILGIADSGLHNMLIGGAQPPIIAGIDLEEASAVQAAFEPGALLAARSRFFMKRSSGVPSWRPALSSALSSFSLPPSPPPAALDFWNSVHASPLGSHFISASIFQHNWHAIARS